MNIRLSPMNVRRKTVKLADARAKAQQAEGEWQETIRVALSQGVPAADIAEAAGISRQRVYQIRDGKR